MAFLPKILKNKSFLLYALLLSVLFRIIIFFLINYPYINYWEYGTIAEYILSGKGYAFYTIENNQLCHDYNVYGNVTQSAYMPPGYTMLLLPFFMIQNFFVKGVMLFMFQNFVSLFTAYIFYQYIQLKFNNNIALLSTIIYILLPEFIIVNYMVGTTVVFHLLVISILYLISKIQQQQKHKIYALAILIAITIYFRSEFAGFFILMLLVLFYQRKFKFALISLAIVTAILSPWVIRNYLVFDRFIPFTTNGGFNLYRGHNYEVNSTWPDVLDSVKYQAALNEPHVEIALDRMYKQDAIGAILNTPFKQLKTSYLYFIKFWGIDWEDTRTHHVAYWLPWLILLLAFPIGLWATFNPRKYRWEYLLFIYYTFIVMIFFPLPRYQTMIKIVVLPFAAAGLIFLYQKIKSQVCNESQRKIDA